MNSIVVTRNKVLDKISFYIQSNLRLMLTLAFIIAIYIPISSERRSNLNTLIEKSVNTWISGEQGTKGINALFVNLLSSINELIVKGIDRTFLFFKNLLDFYIGIISFDSNLIRTTGFVFSAIFLLMPILFVYMIYRFIWGLKDSEFNNEVYSKVVRFISPNKLIIFLLLIPITQDIIWIGSLIAIVLVLYWYFNDYYVRRSENKIFSISELVSWKKSLFVVFSIIYLGISILSHFEKNEYSLTSFLRIDPNTLMFEIVILFVILLCFWVVFQSFVTKESLLLVIKRKFKEISNHNNLIIIISLFLFIFSFLDIIIFQNPTSNFLYFVLNIPWMFTLVIHNPSEFLLSIISIIRFTFDFVIDASRIIFNTIIPPKPTENSILGIIQPTLWVSLLLFVWIIILYITYQVIIDLITDSNIKKHYRMKSNLIFANTIFFSLMVFTFLYFIFGEYIKINLNSMKLLMWVVLFFVVFEIFFTLSLVFISQNVESWSYFQKFRSNFVNLLLYLIVFGFIFIFTSQNFILLFNDLYEVQTDLFGSFFVFSFVLFIFLMVIFIFYWSYIQIKRGRSWRIITNIVLINTTAVILAVVMIIPFIWMLKNSFQTNSQNTADFLQQGLIPNPFTTKNYSQLFGIVDPNYATLEYRVITWLFNSFVTAIVVTIFLVFFSAMAGYVLAKREFIGRKLLFTLIIAIMMIPPYVQVIPLFLELSNLGLRGSLLGVILPFLIQPFSIFLATEFMRGIPEDYLDAARVDGYSEFEIFRKIVLPLSIPVISVMIIINLIANWNSFMWPLLLLEQVDLSPQIRTLPLGIYLINGSLEEQIGVILALSTLIVLPIFIILFLAQDYIKKGVTIEGLKG